MTAVVVIEAIAIALLGLLVAGLLRSHAEILRQLHDLTEGAHPASAEPSNLRLPAGIPVPREDAQSAFDIAGETPAGEAVAISVVGASQKTLLAFLSSGCVSCAGFWDELREDGTLGLSNDTRVLAVSKGPEDESLSQIRRVAPRHVPVIMSTQAWIDYGVPGAPYFILVDGLRGVVVGEGSASTWSDVKSLMSQALADAGAMSTLASLGHATVPGLDRADAELMSAGISPGHPSLYGVAHSLCKPQISPDKL